MPDARFAGLTPLFAPRSVAVLGASSDPTRISGRPLAYMKAQGFQGALYPINPNRAEVQGLKAYPSIADLPETPDVAIVAIAAEIAENSISELAARGVKAAVMFTAGFAEMDEAGEAAQHRMVAAARKHGMRILGPNCLGVFDSRTAYYATFSSSFDSGWPVPGRIGIASQSGAYGTHLYTLARNRGIGASLCIMTGNEADVTVGECIGWLAESPDVDVIAVYAEGIREAPGLIAAFEAARAAKKPIVMQKVGRSELGGKAAKSHTASIAGRRCGDRGGHGRVRRGARAQLRGDAGHRAHRNPEDISGAQYVGRDHGVGRSRRADERRRGCGRSADAGDAGGDAEDAARPGAVLCTAQSGGCHGTGQQQRRIDRDFHRGDGEGWRLRVRAWASSA